MDFVAELGNPALKPMDNPVFLSLVERSGAAFLVDLTRAQQRIDNHKNLMSKRDNRLLLATPCGQPPVEGRQKCFRLLDRCPSSLDQRASQVFVPIADTC